MASFRDISQRIRTEQIVTESAAKLRESNRLISLAEDLARVGHWRLDFAASSFDYSIQINRIAGISRRETLTPRRALRLLDGEDRRILLATLARARRAERACECEVGVRAQDGARRRVCIVVQGDRAHGELTGMIGVVRDVTAERRAHDELVRARDRAKAAAQAKARFLATMSHEIRTPMTGVMGMIDLLAREPSPADRARYFDMLRTSADLLLAVLDDILDFSKIDSGRLLLERRPFALDRLLEESAAMFERRASEKGLTLRFAHEGRPCAVLGDAMRLRQVVSNLLSNAIKFSERGAIELALATSESGGDTRVAITVRDEGIGIDPALHADLFDPFVQADESTSRQFGGTGLGLAICRRLVEAMDGTVSLDSAPGAGSTFRVDLLLPTAAFEMVEVEAAPSAHGPRQAVRPLDLLVAEDNPVNQMLIGAILRAEGHRVHAVENGRLAVEAAARERFDAIIMDMQMPEMDGLAATRAIRASGGPCAEVPILALTADASPERRRSYDGAGLSAFLTKPIDQEALSDQLRAIARLSDPVASPPVEAGQAIEQEAAPEAGAPLATGAPASLLDTARIAEIETVLGGERVHQLLVLLDTELAQRPQAIVEAIAAGDRPTALALAHGLKGAAGNIGADAVASLAAAFTEPGADLVALGRRLEAVAARTRKAIDVFSAPPMRAAHL